MRGRPVVYGVTFRNSPTWKIGPESDIAIEQCSFEFDPAVPAGIDVRA